MNCGKNDFFFLINKVDVSNYQEVLEARNSIKRDLGLIDILVNNAGLLPKLSLREGNVSNIEKIIQVNLLAHFWVKTDNLVKYKVIRTKNNNFLDNPRIHGRYDQET